MINAFLLIVLFIVLATLAAFWYWGSKENEQQTLELRQKRMEKLQKSREENAAK